MERRVVHLIHSSLTKYARLWVLLWTYSAFGFESYNGHLKYLFHSKVNIIDQLAFNVDIQQTLHLLQHSLLKKELIEVLRFLDVANRISPKTKCAQS